MKNTNVASMKKTSSKKAENNLMANLDTQNRGDAVANKIPYVTTSFRIPFSVREELTETSRLTGITITRIVTDALEEYLPKVKAMYKK